jgi:hypothetical protein
LRHERRWRERVFLLLFLCPQTCRARKKSAVRRRGVPPRFSLSQRERAGVRGFARGGRGAGGEARGCPVRRTAYAALRPQTSTDRPIHFVGPGGPLDTAHTAPPAILSLQREGYRARSVRKSAADFQRVAHRHYIGQVERSGDRSTTAKNPPQASSRCERRRYDRHEARVVNRGAGRLEFGVYRRSRAGALGVCARWGRRSVFPG